jgi:hypothetical protein
MADLSDRRLRELYAAREREEHPSDRSWERLACGEVSPEERATMLEHAGSCPSCAELFTALSRLEEEARRAGIDPPRPAWRPPRVTAHPWRWAVAAAAAVLVVVAVPLGRRAPSPSAEDDPLRATARVARPEPIAPLDALESAPATLSWRGLGEGWSYRVEILDGLGEPLWESQRTSAISVAWPAEVPVPPGATFYWRVVAQPTGGGEPAVSPLARFARTAVSD